MVICRQCNKTAVSVKHDYKASNEKVLFSYTHEDGIEHQLWIIALDAIPAVWDDKKQQAHT